jgi:hypothetical protein
MRIEMALQGSQNIHALAFDLFLQPGCGLLAGAVVMAHCGARTAGGFQHTGLKGQVIINAFILYHEYEIEVSPLWIWMRDMGHADGFLPLLDHIPDLLVNL